MHARETRVRMFIAQKRVQFLSSGLVDAGTRRRVDLKQTGIEVRWSAISRAGGQLPSVTFNKSKGYLPVTDLIFFRVGLVGIVTRQRAGRLRNRGSIAGRGRSFSLLQNIQNGCGPFQSPIQRVWGLFSRRQSSRGMNLCTHLYIVLRLRMRGALYATPIRLCVMWTDRFRFTSCQALFRT